MAALTLTLGSTELAEVSHPKRTGEARRVGTNEHSLEVE
jgi:hypothetical protein